MSAALTFVRLAMDAHGQPLGDDLVLISTSQAALAGEFGLSRGTIHKYLRQLDGAVRVTGGKIVVDRSMLDRLGLAVAEVSHFPPVVLSAETAGEISFLLESMAATIATLGALLAPVAAVEEGRAGGRAGGAPELMRAPCAPPCAPIARPGAPPGAPPTGEGETPGGQGFWPDDGPGNASGFGAFGGVGEVGSSLGSRDSELPSYLAGGAPHGQGAPSSEASSTATTRRERLSDAGAIDAALATLAAAAARSSFRPSATVDAKGRHWLGLYSPDELANLAAHAVAKIGSGELTTSAGGWMVRMAMRGEMAFMAPPVSASPPAVRHAVVDEPEPVRIDEDAVAVARAQLATMRTRRPAGATP